MKVVLVNFSDTKGGAAKATYRLHKALLQLNVDCKMLVLDKQLKEASIIKPKRILDKILFKIQTIVNTFPLKKYDVSVPFSASFAPSFNTVNYINQLKPDVVHLHWIHAGMLKIEDIAKINAPIIWSLHDMWAFTGGCHYTENCTKFIKSCGSCPILKSNTEIDLSKKIYIRKQKSYKKIKNLTFVGLSSWLCNEAKKSNLLEPTTIVNLPNTINTNFFKPIDKNVARNFFKLSTKKQYVLFGAMFATSDERKGYNQLKEALLKLKNKDIELLIFGSDKPKNPEKFGFETHYFGNVTDEEKLIYLYNSADVTVVPSLQENLSNVIMESLSCGTPVVGFDIGGNPDLIIHKQNGYLAEPFNEEDLANGINWILSNNQYNILGSSARNHIIKNYDYNVVSKKYFELYKASVKK